MVLRKPLLLTALGFGLRFRPYSGAMWLICLSLRHSVYNNVIMSTTTWLWLGVYAPVIIDKTKFIVTWNGRS